MAGLDRANVDRIVSFDPMIVPTGRRVHAGVALAADPGRRPALPPRPRAPAARRGCSSSGARPCTASSFLIDVKHRFDCLHVAFGIQDDELSALLERHQITFNVHNEPYPSFENRVFLHLAAGHLVITEPLSPTHGLDRRRRLRGDHDPGGAARGCRRARADLDAFRRDPRAAAVQKAERRARRRLVWPRRCDSRR